METETVTARIKVPRELLAEFRTEDTSPFISSSTSVDISMDEDSHLELVIIGLMDMEETHHPDENHSDYFMLRGQLFPTSIRLEVVG
jgi:hypothetical protein